ncbi:cathepsin B [Bemisia tabaci]
MAAVKVVAVCLFVALAEYSGVSAFIASHEKNIELSAEHLDKIAKDVNEAGASWTAGRNFPGGVSSDDLRSLVSEHDSLDDTPQKAQTCDCSSKKLQDDDKNYDAREKWKSKCPSIVQIQNQGNCQSSWAVTAAAVISDRQCIATDGKMKDQMSAQHLLSCCSNCGLGCNNGWPRKAFVFYHKHGVVTGGDYNSKQGCQPYEIAPTTDYKSALGGHGDIQTPQCSDTCTNNQFKKTMKEDLHFGKPPVEVCCCGAKDQIKEHGPIVATMVVYEDFLTYKSGIYRHIWGKKIGYQTVRLLGWGTENGEDYWIASNSWGTGWGDGGFFKIRRVPMGQPSECEIQNAYTAPAVKHKKH